MQVRTKVLAAVTGALAVAAGAVALQQSLASSPPRTYLLTTTASREVYGLGSRLGVTVPTRDDLRFGFAKPDPEPGSEAHEGRRDQRLRYALHFRARGVARPRQVKVYLNGVQVRDVLPDSEAAGRDQRIVLPTPRLLDSNEVMFEHADNPPDAVPWSIANLRLAVDSLHLPACGPGPLIKEARHLHEIALARLRDDPTLAPDSRVAAWNALHRALLYLEVIDPPSDLSQTIKGELASLDADLRGLCDDTVAAAESGVSPEVALMIYEAGLRYFPEDDEPHPCWEQLLERVHCRGWGVGREAQPVP